MNKLSNNNNPIYKLFETIGSLILLNICFIVGCLPIFTIGTSITSCYYSLFKLIEEKDQDVFKNYLHSFKLNFKIGTKATIYFLCIVLVIFAWSIVESQMRNGTINLIVKLFIYILFIVTFLMQLYFFPLLARFENSFKQLLTNSLLMPIRHLHFTIIVALIQFLWIIISYEYPVIIGYGLFWLLINFSLLFGISAYFFLKIFNQYIPS
ncbi:YesL family protein [Fundicoccus sp. Sow4_H7]|uniref:YesL family protein n=1 Tax=Fundicoccus sp. Sow4_H7 TaxID=3438784 RepID=UPI003F9375B9